MRWLSLCLFLWQICSANAQLHGSDAMFNANDLASGGSMFRSFDNRFKGIEGVPVLFDKYQNGMVKLTSGKWYKIDSLNYDAHNDELLVKRDLNEIIISKKMVSDFTFLVKGDSIHFLKIKEVGNNNKEGYFRVSFHDKLMLLVKEHKAISSPTNTGAYSSGRVHSEFILKKRYFIRLEDGNLVEIKDKKSFVAIFKDQKPGIDTYIKKNKTNFKREADLIQLALFIQ